MWVDGNNLRFDMDGSPGRCEITTTDFYDLSGKKVDVHIPPITNYYPPMRVFLAVIDADGNRIEFALHDGLFEGITTIGDVETYSETANYKPEPSYWRIRDFGSDIWLEISDNDTGFIADLTMTRPFDVGRVRLNVGVEVLAPMDGSIGITVPGFNTASNAPP